MSGRPSGRGWADKLSGSLVGVDNLAPGTVEHDSLVDDIEEVRHSRSRASFGL